MPVEANIFSGSEWILVLAVLLLLFGASKLPQLARALGQSAKELKKGLREGEEEEERAQSSIREADALPSGSSAGRPKSRSRSRENS